MNWKKRLTVFLFFLMIFSSIIINPFNTEISYAAETGNLPLGSFVQFGEFEGQPIDWIVLEQDSTKTLLMSVDIIDGVEFYDGQMTDEDYFRDKAGWQNSNGRSWINSTFYNSAFTAEEKGFIIPGHRTLKANNKNITGDFWDGIKDNIAVYVRLGSIQWSTAAKNKFISHSEIVNDNVVVPSIYEINLFSKLMIEGKIERGHDIWAQTATRDYEFDLWGNNWFSHFSLSSLSYNAYHPNSIDSRCEYYMPVINLKNGIDLKGSGTRTDPYKYLTNAPPVLNSITAPAANSQHITNSTLSVSGSLKDEDAGQALDIQYRIGSGAWKALNTVTATGNNQNFTGNVPLTGLAEGNHILSFRVVDADAEASNTISRTIQVVSILKEVNEKISNYLPSGQNQDSKVVVVNTNNAINNNTTNTNLMNSIKGNLNNRDVDGLFFIGQGGSYVQSNLTNPYKDSKTNQTASINVPAITEYITEKSRKINKEPSDKLVVSESIVAYLNSYEMDFYDTEKDYYGISIADKLRTVELEREKRKPNPYGYYHNGEYYPLRVKYEHNHNFYDTPAPTQHARGDGEWFYVKDLSTDPNLITEFNQDMRGEWKLYVQAYDYTGRTEEGRDEYDKESDVNDYYTFLVHNYPTARIHKTSETGTTINLSAANSFDIDYITSKANNGIASYQWKGQPRSGTGVWTNLGTGKTVAVNKNTYKTVELTVTDFDGATDTVVMDIDYIPPTVIEPEPSFVLPQETFIGTHGSDKLDIIDITKNKELITSRTYNFGFKSSSGYLNASSSTSTAENPSFAENTLKYNGNASVLSVNPKTVRLSVNSSTSNNIQSPINYIRFIPVSITNIEIEPNDYVVSEDKFDVIVTTDNGQAGPHELFVMLEGDNNKHKANYEGGNKWRVTLTAPSTPSTDTIVKFKINALIRQTDNSNVIYDRTDIAATGANPGREKEVEVLNAELDFNYITKKYDKAPNEFNLKHGSYPYYAYAGEKIFLKDGVQGTGIDYLLRKSIWLDRGNKIGEGEETEIGYIQEGPHTYTQNIEIHNTTNGKVYEMPKNLSKQIQMFQLQVEGEQDEVWSIGSTQNIKAIVGPTESIVDFNDFTVWLEINYKLKDDSYHKEKIQLNRVGTTNTYAKDIFIGKTVTLGNGEVKEIESGEHAIEYVVRSTRSGENDTEKTMHTLAIDDTNKITILMPQIIADDIVEYATYQKEVEITALGIDKGLNIFARIDGLFDEINLVETEETKYKFKINPNNPIPVQKDSENINIPIVGKKIDYVVRDINNDKVEFLEYVKNGVVIPTSDYNLTIITPRFKRDNSNNLIAVNTPKEVYPTSTFSLDIETEEMNIDKFDVVAKSVLFENDVHMNNVGEQQNRFEYYINQPFTNKAGYYDITYEIINKENGRLVDQVVQEIFIVAELFNPRIIDIKSGVPTTTLVPNREYDYCVDSTINVSSVDVTYIEEVSLEPMEPYGTNESNEFLEILTWRKNIPPNRTLDISTVKGNIQVKDNDKSQNPNVVIVDDIANFKGTSADANFNPSLDYDIDVKVTIEGNISGLEKIVNGEDPVPLNTIPASEDLVVKGIQIVTNVELDSTELFIPVNLYQSGETRLTEDLTVIDSTTASLGTETAYVYMLDDVQINIPEKTLDGDYSIYIKASTINGSYNNIEIANFKVVTPVNLVPKMPPVIVTEIRAEIKATTSKYVNSVLVDVFNNNAHVLTMVKDGGVYKADGEYKQNWKVGFNVPVMPEGDYTAKFTAKTPNNNIEVKTQKFKVVSVKLDNFRAITVYDIRWKDLFVDSSNRRSGYIIPRESMPVRNHPGSQNHPIRLGYKVEFEIDSIGLDPKNIDPADNVYINVRVKNSSGSDITSSIPVNYRTIGKSNSKFNTVFRGDTYHGTWRFEYYLPSNIIGKGHGNYLDVEFEIIASKLSGDVYNYNVMNEFNGRTFRYSTTRTAEDDFYIQGGN